MGSLRLTFCITHTLPANVALFPGTTGLKKHDVGRRKNAITDLPKGSDFPTPSTHGPTVFIACPATVVHNWCAHLSFFFLPLRRTDQPLPQGARIQNCAYKDKPST